MAWHSRHYCSLVCQHLRHCFIGTHFWYWSLGTPTTKLTHQKRQRVYISSPKSLRSTFMSSQHALKQSGNNDKSTWSTLLAHTVKNFNTSKPDLVLQFKTNDYIIRLLVIELSEKYLGRVKRAFRLLKPNFGLVI